MTLPEPLPTPESTRLAQTWLTAAADGRRTASVELDDAVARWLDAVALILNARQSRSR